MTAPLVVLALGGNAVSPPAGDPSLATERRLLSAAADELAVLVRDRSTRLLVVHGNGPQVGRLLDLDVGLEDLDVRVAQTQGELGYLLAEALERRLGTPAVALVTRAVVDPHDPAFARPTKPVGRVLASPPPGAPCAATADGGWRRVVASPRPLAVVELDAIALLLAGGRHVVAGGGGGVPLARTARGRRPAPAVIDKDWVAGLLAVALDAARLVFLTDVSHAFDDFAGARRPIARMTPAEARTRLAGGVFAEGSMKPKVASAVAYVEARGRPAIITTMGSLADALEGRSGTRIVPDA